VVSPILFPSEASLAFLHASHTYFVPFSSALRNADKRCTDFVQLVLATFRHI
jgi:hypothetical protein